jgi:peptidoglycan/LPS O-acetylase OafA/YrhL
MLFAFNRLGGWPVDNIWRVAFPPIEAAVWSGVILTYLSFGRLLPLALTQPLVALGVVSYSAYLLHPVLINIVVTRQWWIAATSVHQWDAMITVALLVLPALLLLATLTFRLIEAPAMALRPQYAFSEETPTSQRV